MDALSTLSGLILAVILGVVVGLYFKFFYVEDTA